MAATLPDRVPYSPDLDPQGPDGYDTDTAPAYVDHDTPQGYDGLPDIKIPKPRINS